MARGVKESRGAWPGGLEVVWIARIRRGGLGRLVWYGMSWSDGTAGRVEAVRDEVLFSIQARIVSIRRRSYPGSSESEEYIVSVIQTLYDAAYNCTTRYPACVWIMDMAGHVPLSSHTPSTPLPLSSHTIDATQGNPSICSLSSRDMDHQVSIIQSSHHLGVLGSGRRPITATHSPS